MSLLLDFDRPRKVVWDKANVTMDFIPLTEAKNLEFVAQTTSEVLAGEELQKMQRDVQAYMELVGTYCIKGWSGVFLNETQEAKCTPANIKKVMKLQVVQNFVLSKVLSLDVVLKKEVEEAKKG